MLSYGRSCRERVDFVRAAGRCPSLNGYVRSVETLTAPLWAVPAKRPHQSVGWRVRCQQVFLPGNSAETRGDAGCTSAPTWWATRRTIRSPSAADNRFPVSASPSVRRSILKRPSGLSMTSTTAGSSSQAAMAGPSAVRNIRAPRETASAVKESHHPRPRRSRPPNAVEFAG